MDLPILVFSILAGYLIGSISSARIVTRIFTSAKEPPGQTEIRMAGSDKTMVLNTISASSVSVNYGAKYGFLTYVMDVLKIFIPVLLIKRNYPDSYYFLIFATFGVAGHIWPVYHKFRGGRGISAIYGTLFAIDWIAVFVTSIGGMIFGLFILRDVFFAYMAGLWFVIPWLWFRTHDLYYVIFAVLVNILFAISMIPEAKQWFKIKKEDKWDDPTEVFQISAMGRGIIKMAKKLGIIKHKSKQDSL
jgi:glycerol-3-phosphate acyltransferase PlsY